MSGKDAFCLFVQSQMVRRQRNLIAGSANRLRDVQLLSIPSSDHYRIYRWQTCET